MGISEFKFYNINSSPRISQINEEKYLVRHEEIQRYTVPTRMNIPRLVNMPQSSVQGLVIHRAMVLQTALCKFQ